MSRFAFAITGGDGSLLLVDLPGHAEGHVGFILNTDSGRIFYVADAFWDIRVLHAGRQIPRLSRRIQQDWPRYLRTQEKLSALEKAVEAGELPLQLYATHCPTTYEKGRSDEN